MSIPISVLILTKNEANILAECLSAVRWSDDVVILDSFSTDDTVKIAVECGARIFQREFDNERSHREASLKLPFKYSWVFNPDADEITTPELALEMGNVITTNTGIVAFRLRFKNIFMGRWLRYSSLYPTWIVRLFRPEYITFSRSINLNYVVAGTEGRLQGHLIHLTFNKGLEAWIQKHNCYSTAEANETVTFRRDRRWDALGCFSPDPVRRRHSLKQLSIMLPCRASLRFIYMYCYRRGFLDGVPGFIYCCLMRNYESMIAIKVRHTTYITSTPQVNESISPDNPLHE